MGHQRKFRLSDMMPNSWFYRLRDMRRAQARSGAGGAVQGSSSSLGASGRTQPAGTPRPVPLPLPHRASYYYASRDRELKPSPAPQPWAAREDRHQPVPQTQSPSRISRRRRRAGHVEKGTEPEIVPVAEAPVARHRRRDMYVGRDGGDGDAAKVIRKPKPKAPPPPGGIPGGKVITSETDIIFDLRADDVPERVLRPIVTRPATARREAFGGRHEVKKERHAVHRGATMTPRASSASEQGAAKDSPRRSSVSSGRRLRTRANSPRLACRCRKDKTTPTTPTTATTPAAASARKKKKTPAPAPAPASPPSPLAESFAVVKMSGDPRSDFRKSMVEMIAEKGIRRAADLENLLACYLALNAAEHHDLIVEVFEEIWRCLAGANP